MGAGGRKPVALLILSVAALLSSWNPASAPLGFSVAAAVAVLCVAERRRAGRFAPAVRAALGLALVAAVASAAVIGLAAGVGRLRDGRQIVDESTQGNREEQLDRAADRTKSARDAARRELEQLGPDRR